jgi:hypothetical protein
LPDSLLAIRRYIDSWQAERSSTVFSGGSMPIYEVTVQAPAVNEIITTEAEDEQQAKERAVASALGRQAEAATVTVKRIPIRG